MVRWGGTGQRHDGLLYGCSMYHSGLMTAQCRGQTMTKKKKHHNIRLPGNKALNNPCLDQWFHLLKVSQTINK